MFKMSATVLFIGDLHIQISNIQEVDMFIERITILATEKQPDIILIAGDLLHTHERLHTTALNKAYEFVDKMRKISKTYLLVGNHDMCLGKNTPVLLWNGNIKMSQNIKTGDILIGDDGRQRNVLQTISGRKKMYNVHQENGADYSVSEDHILTLKTDFSESLFFDKTVNCWTVKWFDKTTMRIKSDTFSKNSKQEAVDFFKTIEHTDIIDISVKEYIKAPKNVRDTLYGFCGGVVHWEKQEILLEPYIMGMFLANRNKDISVFSTTDLKLINEWCEWANKNNSQVIHTGQYNYRIRSLNHENESFIHVGSPESSCYTCKACIINKKVFGKSPSLACANSDEILRLIQKDQEIIDYLSQRATKEQLHTLSSIEELEEQYNLRKRTLNHSTSISSTNPLIDIIKHYKIYKTKHIPLEYTINDYDSRLQLLAGFIDVVGNVTDEGRTIFITQKDNNTHLIEEIEYLAKSLGFSINKTKETYNGYYISNTIQIYGNIEIIPTRLKRKRCFSSESDLSDKFLNRISLSYKGVSEYYGFSVDNNNRFLLGDFTVTHNCNNQNFLDTNHWMNGMKEWDNTVIVDKIVSEEIKGVKFVFSPYVPPGRFEEALNTLEEGWKDAYCIFAHQEFAGCKMGAVVSVEGDRWPLTNPHVVSGHIHSKQQPQENIYYSGSAMQHAFGESEENIVAYLTFEQGAPGYNKEEIDLDLPRKKIVYMDVEDIDDYYVPETDDKIKVTVSGSYDQFKALKKTKKYKNILEKGVKVVFKPKKAEIKKHKESLENSCIEEEKDVDDTNFNTILLNIVNNQKNPYLLQAFELVVNNREIGDDDILFL